MTYRCDQCHDEGTVWVYRGSVIDPEDHGGLLETCTEPISTEPCPECSTPSDQEQSDEPRQQRETD